MPVSLLLTSAVLVAFLGGVVALLAPCCVSVMLPAYLASGLRSRTRILTMTLVFAAGVGTLILPLALGASALSRLILGNHTPVFAVGGVLMLAGGIAMALGASFKLPMPGSAPRVGGGLGSVYVLGLFSGAASACCAPVLAGVVALASVAGSFAVASVIGVTYVFGMVAPLAAFALVWDRRDWGQSRFFRANSIKIRLGRRRRPTSLANLLSGGLLAAMGVLTAVLAFRGPAMSGGWQVRLTARLQHWASVLRNALEPIPGWISALVVLGLLAAFIWAASRPRPLVPPITSTDDQPVAGSNVPCCTGSSADAGTPDLKTASR